MHLLQGLAIWTLQEEEAVLANCWSFVVVKFLRSDVLATQHSYHLGTQICPLGEDSASPPPRFIPPTGEES